LDRRKLESAALFLTVLGAMLIMPPLVQLFQIERRFLGLPAEVIYLFIVWAALVAAAWWLGRKLPHEPAADAREDDA
jgi:hypothetical protein